MEALLNADALIALVTLTVLEVVLGVDNMIFISILAGKLPAGQQDRARRVGLLAAMGMRIALLFSLAWIVRLTAPLFTVVGNGDLGARSDPPRRRPVPALQGDARDPRQTGRRRGARSARVAPSFAAVIGQIMLLDIVFSLDSVITAVGMADDLIVMVLAVIVAVGIMMMSAGAISRFVNQHPTVKMLALSVPAADRRVARGRGPRISTSPRATSTSRWPSRCSSR